MSIVSFVIAIRS